MGWASGSEVACPIIEAIKNEVDDPKIRLRLYKAVLKTLESQDWDTQNEACGIDPIFDKLIGMSESEEP